MRTIFLIIIALSSLSQAEFSRENGVVTDSETNLEWQDNYNNAWNDVSDIKKATWSDAIEYCEELNLNGQGWRLPNINELKSLVMHHEPSIDGIFKHHDRLTYLSFWSSTSNANNSDEAWLVEFYYGKQYYVNKENSTRVRCVRNRRDFFFLDSLL